MDNDCDGEPMSYLWTVTSGDDGLRLASTSAATETVEVEVEVTDRVGDVGVDVVSVVYECSGE